MQKKVSSHSGYVNSETTSFISDAKILLLFNNPKKSMGFRNHLSPSLFKTFVIVQPKWNLIIYPGRN